MTSIPLATARALKLIGAHPSVADVRVLARYHDGAVVAEVAVRTELPAAWRPAGRSPSGVRRIEPVTFTFAPDHPVHAPRMTLRDDFDRSHPHINSGPADRPPVPCVVDGDAAELVQARGIDGLVDQLVAWLDRASTAALNDPERGWEPIRRDGIDDLMVVDGDGLRALAGPSGGCVLVPTAFVLRDEGGGRTYLVDHCENAAVDLKAARFGRVAAGAGIWRGTGVGLVAWARDTLRGPFVVDRYLPETVSTIGELRDRAALYGCRVELDAVLNQLAFGLDAKVFEPTPLTVIFLVRRPYDVIGTTSPIELCPYLVHVTRGRDLIVEDDPIVRLCAPRERLSLAMLRRASGEGEAPGRAPWTLLGCGSVGSKIALHLARRGFGPSLVVDRGFMSPHNYARHALTPPPGSVRDLGHKATMLADALSRLRQAAKADAIDAIAACSTPEGRGRMVQRDGGLLDTTASSVLRERLAFLDWEERPAIGEAHLLGVGRVAYAAFEGAGGNPNLSDLAVESYRLISNDRDLAGSVFSAEAEAVSIGQGCSAFTFPMSDGRLSALASGLAEAVAMRHFPRPGADGEIRLGKLGTDGLSQVWTREAVRPWTVFRIGGVEVRMSARVDEAVRAEVAARPDGETGGIVVGRFSQVGNAFHVVDVLPAPSDSAFSREKFVLGTVGLKAAIRKLVRESGGSLHVLGTWHNHLVRSGPSTLDADTAAHLALRQFYPVLMVIALPEGYTGLVAESFDPTIFADPPRGADEGVADGG